MNSLTRLLTTRRQRERQREERRRAEKHLQNLSGGGDCWMHYEYFKRAKAHGIRGIPDARCFTLQSAIRSLRGVAGDVAECGVRFGKSTVFMLEADQANRQYHLFDSFEGVSDPSPEDTLGGTGQAYWHKGDIAVPESETRANLQAYSNVTIHRGWIPDRFPDVSDRSFALVHLDVDLYGPTRDSLAFFWPRLVSGGLLVCDDYGSSKCPGARRAVDEFFAERDCGVLELSTAQALVAKHEIQA
jgi:O-methyltransferase